MQELKVSLGQHTDKGRKEINQDFHGAFIPRQPLLRSKGIAVALADGIGSSSVSQVASESAVKAFLEDYYCTSDAWSARTSAQRVIAATNSWLHAQTRHSVHRYEADKGYVCTLSAVVFKSTTAHLFHVGDTRIYRLRGKQWEQLTEDHRVYAGADQTYLARALGMSAHVDIDYQALPIEAGDILVLMTDGVYEHVKLDFIAKTLRGAANLDAAAKRIVEEAYGQGSNDNMTVQIARVDALPAPEPKEVYKQFAELPPPPILDARSIFDGYRIVRELHGSNRSHIYLAVDVESDAQVVIKTPSIDMSGDAAYLERFLMEEWVARRIDSPHVLKASPPLRERKYLYVVMEYVEGSTLRQWMRDHPQPDLESVRRILDQIGKGLQTFHRLEMLHQDLRPENVMIDGTGTIKLIDFSSASVSGLEESRTRASTEILGTTQYAAPEYFLGEAGAPRSDLYSLGAIAYEMLCGRLPYGTQVATARTAAAQRKLQYRTVVDEDSEIPAWVDGALRKALHPDPLKRYQELSEFLFDLRQPNMELLKDRPPFIERHPLLFWKVTSFILGLIVLVLGALLTLR